MRDNPLSLALFGPYPARRVRCGETLYHLVLATLPQPPLVARRGNVVVGLAALAPPGRCIIQVTLNARKEVHLGGKSVGFAMPPMPRGLIWPLLRQGPATLGRISTMTEATARHHPTERHGHLELVVVEAGLQGLGIGRRMMTALCAEMDGYPDPTHLETDKPENVRFYEQFGFATVAEETILGAHMWYMLRRH